MRFVTWTLRLLVFFALLAFAVKNTDPVTLRFFFELAWQTPLIVLLLAFFAAGAVFGLLAALATLFGQRREILRLKRDLRDQRASGSGPMADHDGRARPGGGASGDVLVGGRAREYRAGRRGHAGPSDPRSV